MIQTYNPFPHNDTFLRPWETSLLKTLYEAMVFYGRNKKGKRTLIWPGKSQFFTQCQPSKGENDTVSDVYNYLNENKHDWDILDGLNFLPDDNFLLFRMETFFRQ